MKNIVEPEMMFCTKHILLMYFKKTLHRDPDFKKKKKANHDSDQEQDENESFENDFSENDLFDIENETHF